MKKIIFAIAAITVATLVYLVFQLRGAAPAILPPKLSSPGTAPITTSTKNELGLKIPEGFSIDIFAKDLDGPRDLVFDDTGNLLASIPSKCRIVAISNQGEVTEILANLTHPHGLAFYGGKLYIAQETQVSRYNWNSSNLSTTLDKVLFPLPAGGRHFTRSIAFKNSKQFPEGWQGDLLVAFHGSWNSSKPVGYKVVKLKVKGDNIIGEEDFISG